MNVKTIIVPNKLNIVAGLGVLLLLMLGVIGGVIFGAPDRASAASPTIYLSPSTKSVEKGNSFSVAVRFNPSGIPVNTVAFTANFDSSKLTLTSKSLSGGAMTTSMVNSSTSSSVSFEGARLGGQITSDSLIETLTFKAVGGSGSTAISFSDARANRADNNAELIVSRGSGTISFTTPPISHPNVTSPVTTTPSKSTSTKSSNDTKTAVSSDAPKLTSTSVNVQFTIAKITANSDVPTTAYILFGTAAPTQKTAVSALAKNHSIAIPAKWLQAGTTYNYIVVFTNSKGQVTKSKQMSMTTKGIPIRIQVLDKAGHPLRYTSVTIHSTPQTTKTDANGYANFEVDYGEHVLEYKDGGKTYNHQLVVANNVKTSDGVQRAALQEFSVVFPVTHGNSYLTYILIAAGVLVLLAVGYIVLRLSRPSPVYSAVEGSWGSEHPPVDMVSEQMNSRGYTNNVGTQRTEEFVSNPRADNPTDTQPLQAETYREDK